MIFSESYCGVFDDMSFPKQLSFYVERKSRGVDDMGIKTIDYKYNGITIIYKVVKVCWEKEDK